jgi:beta-glucosidase
MVRVLPGPAVSITLGREDFGFYGDRGTLVVEPGRIDVYAGDSSPHRSP